MTVRVRLLGDVSVDAGGVALPLPASGKATALLVWLALHPGEHPRARVAPVLWPDVLDESARASLRTAVWALRGALGDHASALVATRSAVGLDAETVSVDVLELRRLAADGRLDEAAELAHAELAPGVGEDWLEQERDAHRVLLDGVYEQLAAAAEDAGDGPAAVVWSRRRVWLDPLDEEALQALLRRLAAAGDRAGALHAFSRFRTRLRSELALVPSAETLALVGTIREAATAAPTLPARLAAVSTEAMVGREAEVARLVERWEEASRSPLPVVVAVAAEPGVGKTRLVAELAAVVQGRGRRVAYGAAGREAIVPYQPFVEALSESAEIAPDELADGDAGEPSGARRYRFFERVAALVGDLSRASAPALVALDDLHWADVSTMQLLQHVARSHRARGTLVVLAYRPGELGAPLADLLIDLNRERPLDRVQLDGLAEDEVSELLRGWGVDEPDALARTVHDRTGGNPFFVRELIRDIAEGADPRVSVPQTVRDVVVSRVSRLDAGAQALLSAGAVAGSAFAPEIANAARDEPAGPTELPALVDVLVGSGLVDAEPSGSLRFEHVVVRDALYGALGAGRRAGLHRALADRLVRAHGANSGPHLAEIAHHYREASAPVACDWLLAAADYAFDRLAFDQAARLYGQALQGLVPGDDRRGRIVRRRAMASQLIFHAAFDQAPPGAR